MLHILRLASRHARACLIVGLLAGLALPSLAAALADAVRRNVTMAQEDEAEALAERMIRLDKRLSRTSADQLRKGEFAA